MAKNHQHNLVYIEVGARIKQWREKKSYSQSELASAIKLTRTSIVNIEYGRQAITIEKLLMVSAVLGCKPSDLLPPTPKAVAKQLRKIKRVVEEKLLDVNFKW